MKRYGVLTSGGDCQSLNAALRGTAKALFRLGTDVEIIGFRNGFRGLIHGDYEIMRPEDFSGLLTRGGTILGTSRTPFKQIRDPEKDGLDKIRAMKDTYRDLGLECLIVLGGNGSQKTSNLLSQEGLQVIAVPKTIDNDLWGSDITFGFHSAVEVATNAIDCIHTTAASHGRVFIVELMGHKVGWLTLYAGLAGGADVILLPEIPYDIDSIVRAIRAREAQRKHFTIIAMAEGAISKEMAALPKKEQKELRKKMKKKYPSPAYEIGAAIEEKTGQEVRVTVPGHMQRGGHPTAYDRVIATRLGSEAAAMAIRGEFGRMAAITGGKFVSVPLGDVAGKLKTVDPESEIIHEARAVGISFGNEP